MIFIINIKDARFLITSFKYFASFKSISLLFLDFYTSNSFIVSLLVLPLVPQLRANELLLLALDLVFKLLQAIIQYPLISVKTLLHLLFAERGWCSHGAAEDTVLDRRRRLVRAVIEYRVWHDALRHLAVLKVKSDLLCCLRLVKFRSNILRNAVSIGKMLPALRLLL